MEQFGDRLRKLRQSRGISQQQVAEYLGVNRTTYVKYETGKSEPNVGTLKKLAQYFDISMDYLLCGDEAIEIFSAPDPSITGQVGSLHALLKEILDEMNEDGHKKVAEYASDILPTHRKQK